MAGLGGLIGERKKSGDFLLNSCSLHKLKAKEILRAEPSAVRPLKEIVRHGIELAQGLAETKKGFLWKRAWRRPFRECPLCHALRSEEKLYVSALIHFMDEVHFWKEFHSARLLCQDHLQKCIARGKGRKGLVRLLDDQRVKLNLLLDELVRMEATGTGGQSRVDALELLADSKALSLDVEAPGAFSGQEDEVQAEIFPQADPSGPGDGSADLQALRFENEKLKRQVRDLTELLGRMHSRAASLHYRLAEVTEANKRLEMGYTGANTLASGLEKMVRDLRQEVERLTGKKPTTPSNRIP